MDFVPLIDALGENGAALAGGAVLGGSFGFLAQRTAFCTRSAVLDLTRGRDLSALATWSAGFAAALLAVQLLLQLGHIDVAEARFFSTAQSLSGAVIGGSLFGIGMILTRGCVSRLLVLSAGGNLRAVYSVLVVALAGFATYAGVLMPLRDTVGGLWSSSAIGGNDLLAHLGSGEWAGVLAGVLLAAAAILLAWKSRLSVWRLLGGAGIGLTVAGGWTFTYALSSQVFEPIQVESLSFIRPLATTGALSVDGSAFAGLDQGLLIGTLLGAFAASVLFREFRIVTFAEPGAPSILRYTVGAVLMGFGGILAAGCTIGAGLTGGSVLAVSSLLGLLSMMGGAALGDRIIDRAAPTAYPAGASAVPAK